MAIGLTALIGVVGLAGILLVFGELSFLKERTWRLNARLDTAEGLVRGSSVLLNGVPIGEVRDMAPITEPTADGMGVELILAIHKDVRIPRHLNVGIQIGLIGDGALSFKVANGTHLPIQYFTEDETITATAYTIFDQIASMVEGQLSGLDDAAQAVANMGRRFDELTAPVTPAEVDAGVKPANIASAIARIDNAVAGVESWTSDPQLLADVKASAARLQETIEEARTLFTTWSETAQSIQGAADDVRTAAGDMRTRFDETAREIAAAADSLGLAIQEVRTTASAINAGEGTVGQLISNAELYRSLNDAAIRLERTLTDAQLLIQKWQAEGLPIHF